MRYIIMRKTLITIISIFAISSMLMAQNNDAKTTNAKNYFVSAPTIVFPSMSETKRLDMIDYYEAGYNRATVGELGDSCRVTHIDSLSIRIDVSPVLKYQLALPADNVIMLITTHNIPQPDSEVAFYDTDWNILPLGKCFTSPSLDDWLTKQGHKNRKDVENILPFLLVSYDYDAANGVLTLTNNLKDYFVGKEWEALSPYMHEKLQYRWSGKNFKKIK